MHRENHQFRIFYSAEFSRRWRESNSLEWRANASRKFTSIPQERRKTTNKHVSFVGKHRTTKHRQDISNASTDRLLGQHMDRQQFSTSCDLTCHLPNENNSQFARWVRVVATCSWLVWWFGSSWLKWMLRLFSRVDLLFKRESKRSHDSTTSHKKDELFLNRN